MEFGEKLQELRKNKDMTQEELAEALYVSRTAISKWESGRGYPSIDSLKEISRFFSVSIDELLSAEKMVSIAEKENRDNIRYICDMLLGIIDVLAMIMIVLPIYPNRIDGVYYAVSLPDYVQAGRLKCMLYWAVFILLVIIGAVKILLTRLRQERGSRIITVISVIVGITAVLLLAMGREIPVLTMGPIGITPELKRKGYGKKLLDYCLEKATEMGFGAVLFEGNIGFYSHCGFDYASKFGIRYHDLPEDADSSFFLCRELIPGYLDDVTGVYQTPQGYYVKDEDVEEFDKQFPPKEKKKLPGQLFD